jgi:hypothetical protein
MNLSRIVTKMSICLDKNNIGIIKLINMCQNDKESGIPFVCPE